MPISQMVLPEFDNEMANTRKTLERVPFDKLDYKPHPKSGTVGWYVAHLINLPGWCKETFGLTELDISPDGKPYLGDPVPASKEEMLAKFDKCVAAGRAALAGASDAAWGENWSLLMTGKTIFTMPRAAVYRGMIMNHVIHHRGQLTVYLRLLDVPVPALYGPSGDEQTF